MSIAWCALSAHTRASRHIRSTMSWQAPTWSWAASTRFAISTMNPGHSTGSFRCAEANGSNDCRFWGVLRHHLSVVTRTHYSRIFGSEDHIFFDSLHCYFVTVVSLVIFHLRDNLSACLQSLNKERSPLFSSTGMRLFNDILSNIDGVASQMH